MRILMLGWELPPLITGGLGVACNGLLERLPDDGRCNITFVLPTSAGCRAYPGVSIVGVKEFLGDSEYCAVEPELTTDSKAIGAYSAADDHIKSMMDSYRQVVLDILEKNEFDLIHAHDWLTVPSGILAKRLTGCPLVFHVHSLEQDRSPVRHDAFVRSIEEIGLKTADRIVAVSEWTKARISALHGIDGRRIDVVYNGIKQQDTPDRTEDRASPVVGFLGRITAQKGPKTFVNMARELSRTGAGLSFRMAGIGDLSSSMRALVKAYKMDDCFSFDGLLPQRDIASWLADIDILVVPSVYEPFGIVALEAAQAQVAVVITREAGVCELLENVIKVSNTVNAYADAVRQLSDAVLRRRIVRDASLEISNVTWARAADRLFELYQKCVRIQSFSSPLESLYSDDKLLCE